MLIMLLAAASACAGLPEAGPVGQAAAAEVEAAVPTPARTWACPDDFRLDLRGRVPECTRPGVKIVEGNPRAVCHAAMALGPLAALPERRRPTRSCSQRTVTTIVRLVGANVGWSDAAVGVEPAAGIVMTPLDDGGVDDASANPVVQGCFAWNCRLVRLEISAAAAPVVEVRVALPGRDYVSERLVLRASCRE